ncbi:potassium channel subfamily K member 17 [Denticeps clupeoides]|uniref:potassium channel subfamily K member 17 n=1 Tax=Denticeps clupeoides TaxID=299321 RepID=UPI0010A4CED1|nr:potassium channel subfamily K member 17 [Denticeps clupeoides]
MTDAATVERRRKSQDWRPRSRVVLHSRFLAMTLLAKLSSIFLLGTVYVAYVFIGGAVFWKLEGDMVQQVLADIKEERNAFLNELPCLTAEKLEEVAAWVLAASRRGLSLKTNSTSDGFWKFTSSSVFAATVVTTIGYGNMSPVTVYGQIFCVFFALIGIPLNMVVLNKVGQYMLAFERNICNFIVRRMNHKKIVRVFIHTMSFIMLFILYFVAPVMVVKEFEGWTYTESVYYCFITLSTIGFGDFVADDNPDRMYPQWYAGIVCAWIFFGLAWLALLINHSIELVEEFNAYLKQRRKNASQSLQEEKLPDKQAEVTQNGTTQESHVSETHAEAVQN